MKNLLIITITLFAFLTAQTQIITYNDDFFGSTRTVKPFIDFGKIQQTVTKEIELANTNKVEIKITSVDIPEGFGVIIPKKTIPADSKAKIIINCYPEFISDTGKFEKELIINYQFTTLDGTTTVQKSFKLKGEK